jgi:hypothetical protein
VQLSLREQAERAGAASELLLRIAAMLETSAAKYDWINRNMAVGTGGRPADGPIYNIFEVL